MFRRRMICLLAAVCLVAGFLPMFADAANMVDNGACGDDVFWVYDSECTLTIYGEGPMAYFGVRKTPWYDYRREIKKIVIEPGVTSIGGGAFESCNALESVTIPDTVTEIEISAFAHCGISQIQIPDSVTTIGNSAFSNTHLTSVEIPDSVTSMGNSVFYNCFTLREAKIPSSVVNVGSTMFWNCSNLVKVELDCAYISNSMFSGCESLRDVEIGPNVKTIEAGAFKDCKVLASLSIPATVTEINGHLGTTLKHIQYGGTRDQWVQVLGDTYGIQQESADIHYNSAVPNGITYRKSCNVVVHYCAICDRVFDYERLPYTRYNHDFQDDYCADCGVSKDIEYVVHEDGTIEIMQHDGKDEILVIPEQIEGLPVTRIRDLVEIHNDTTHTVVLPQGLCAIESSWLSDFPAMKTVTVPAAVEKLGRWAFSNMSHLESITFLGDKPEIDPDNFWRMDVTIYYPKDNKTWTNLQQYRGTIRYVPYTVNPFEDVREGKYYYDAVLWAAEEGITSGKTSTTFLPDEGCTRKQVVTFLWRAAGCPEPKSMENPFLDVKADRFEKAILWAYYEGITSGTGDGTTFSPEDTCTRKQIVTFLWRAVGCPEPESVENPFPDVKADRFEKAILWAYHTNITLGTTQTTFTPEATCTRAQVVTFLYRMIVEQRVEL